MMSLGKRFSLPGRAGLLVVLVTMLPAGLLRAQGLSVAEAEPNDTFAQANLLALPNIRITGVTDRLGDVDFFQTVLSEGNVIRIFESGFTTGFDGRVQILNASGVVLAEMSRPSTSGTLVLSYMITAASPPGVGFLRFTNDFFDPENLNTVTWVAEISQGKLEVEPNDTIAQAQPVSLAFPILGAFPAQIGITDDLYSFATTSPDETAVILLTYPQATNLDMKMELLDGEGEILGSAQRTTVSGTGGIKNPSLVTRLEQPGTYFVRLTNPGVIPKGDFTVSYTLSISLKQGAYETEPNQSFREAILMQVAPGQARVTISGSIQAPLDVDLYRVNVPGGNNLIIDLDATSSLVVLDGVISTFLEEDQGISFASNDNSSVAPSGSTFALVNMDPYVRVVPPRGGQIVFGVADIDGRGGAQGFDYDLHVQIAPVSGTENEPNDTPGSERTLESGELVRGTMGTQGDMDRFVIAGKENETLLININAAALGSFLDARVVVRDGAGTVLIDRSQSSFSLDPFVIVESLPQDDDYIIEVSSRPGTGGTGASYFYEIRASLSTSIRVVISDPDIDGSGRVDGFDLADMSRRFGSSLGDPLFSTAADILRDGVIDGQDLSVLGNFFGSQAAFGGISEIVVDTAGDDQPFFGPASVTDDLLGIGTAIIGSVLEVSIFFGNTVTANTGGILSLDTDGSRLTGSLGTPDAYVEQQSLGSNLELFFDTNRVVIFRVPDPRTTIFPAFDAKVGDVRAPTFPLTTSSRTPLLPEELATLPVTVSGNQISFQLDADLLGGSSVTNAAALAVSVGDVEPTDRLPDSGKIALQVPFVFGSKVLTQMVCDDNRRMLCRSDADCGTGCVDMDLLPVDSVGGAPIPPGRTMIYLRTQDGGPLYRDWEKSVPPSIAPADPGTGGGSGQHNDTLDRIFPLGTRGLKVQDSNVQWFTRDILYNFAFRDANFDPHTEGGLPPPDTDYYYFAGAESDQVILHVETADQGASFNSRIELFSIPLSLASLDPTSLASLEVVADADLTLLAMADDQSPIDLDPRLEFTLPSSGIFVVRVSASPAQTVFPGTETPYTIYHQSLRPDEFSIPIIARGSFFGPDLDRVTGLSLYLQFDPAVVRMTGVDLAQGTRNFDLVRSTTGNPRNAANAQEFVAEQVPGTPGLVRFAIRSYRDTVLTVPNGLKNDGLKGGGCNPCPELVIARLRFRVVGVGDTTIEIVDNPTVVGETLLNFGLGEFRDGPIWQPFLGYGPGVQISVTPPAAATLVPPLPGGGAP